MHLTMSRRRLLTTGVASLCAAAAYVGYLGPGKLLLRSATRVRLEPGPTGPLSEPTLRTLVAAAEAFVGYPIEPQHYRNFFTWRAGNLPGHRNLYERFAARLDRLAVRSSGNAFADCDTSRRKHIFDAVYPYPPPHNRWARLRAAISRSEQPLVEQYFVTPTLLLFARTDVWRIVGYSAWPGSPRGLDAYRLGPGGSGTRAVPRPIGRR